MNLSSQSGFFSLEVVLTISMVSIALPVLYMLITSIEVLQSKQSSIAAKLNRFDNLSERLWSEAQNLDSQGSWRSYTGESEVLCEALNNGYKLCSFQINRNEGAEVVSETLNFLSTHE